MADLTFDPVSAGIRTASDLVTLKAAATALTTSYVAFPANPDGVKCVGWEWVRFRLGYTNGDETSIQLVFEGWDGATWGPMVWAGDLSGGVRELTPEVFNITKATINTFVGGTTLTYFTTPSFDCRCLQKVRVKVKSTGGSPTGTLVITATAGIAITGVAH